MNTSQQTEELTKIATQTLEHLATEQEALEAILDCVGRVRTALLERDDTSLDEAVESMQTLQKRQAELRTVREHLQSQAASLLEVAPQTLSLSLLIKRLPPYLAQALSDQQRTLRSLVRDVNRLNRGNMMLISNSAQLTRHVMEVLTGKPIVQRYGKDGQLDSQESLPLFQAEL